MKKIAIKKYFRITLYLFLLLTILTVPKIPIKDNKVLRTNLELEDISSLSTDIIYLKNKNNYLVQTEIFIDSDKIEDKIEKIIHYLIIDNDNIPQGLNGYIPKNTKLLNQKLEENHLVLNFTKEFLNIEEKMISGLVYSLLELKQIKDISIEIENNPKKEYTFLTKQIGINNQYALEDRNNINKVVMYYRDNTDTYYVPVTKIQNDNREKIEIVIDELKETKKNLISLVDNRLKLQDYKEEANVLFLNFNDYLLESNLDRREKILNTIAYSVFENYDVNMVMFEVNKETLKYIERR